MFHKRLCLAAMGFALAAVTPAWATTTTINSTWLGSVPITVGPTDEVDIVPGGSVTNSAGAAVYVHGGVLKMTGGSVSGAQGPGTGSLDQGFGVLVQGGTVTISGGTVSGTGSAPTNNGAGVIIGFDGGTATISDSASVSGSLEGAVVNAGLLSVTGGTISGLLGVLVTGGTANLTGGSMSGNGASGVGMEVRDDGTANISGSSLVSGADAGVRISNAGGTVNVSGGSVSGTGASGIGLGSNGTATVSGGSVSGSVAGVFVFAGTAALSGGVMSGGVDGVRVAGGSATLSGGSVSGTSFAGLEVSDATVTVIGCNLTLVNEQLKGILQDSRVINTRAVAYSPGGQIDLQNSGPGGPPQITGCPSDKTAPATSAAGAVVTYTSPTGSSPCSGTVTVVCSPASGSAFPLGDTTVTCTATDPIGNTTQCSFKVTVVPGADLSISNVAPSTIAGSALTYTLTAANAGPFTAHGVVVTDPLPAGTVFQTGARSANVGSLTTPSKGAGGTVAWAVGDLVSGQSVKLTIVVKVNAPSGSTLANTATVTSSTADPSSSNNSATVQTVVK
jgi:uncharacterized repeat protein (TIGR01451 family)